MQSCDDDIEKKRIEIRAQRDEDIENNDKSNMMECSKHQEPLFCQ
jgi:hypothetical protein